MRRRSRPRRCRRRAAASEERTAATGRVAHGRTARACPAGFAGPGKGPGHQVVGQPARRDVQALGAPPAVGRSRPRARRRPRPPGRRRRRDGPRRGASAPAGVPGARGRRAHPGQAPDLQVRGERHPPAARLARDGDRHHGTPAGGHRRPGRAQWAAAPAGGSSRPRRYRRGRASLRPRGAGRAGAARGHPRAARAGAAARRPARAGALARGRPARHRRVRRHRRRRRRRGHRHRLPRAVPLAARPGRGVAAAGHGHRRGVAVDRCRHRRCWARWSPT